MYKNGMGVIKSPKDLRNYKISKIAKKLLLPDSFELNHPHIKNQEEVNSCVAHSLSSILESNDGVNYSTGWIYGYRPEEYYQGEGMIVNQALKTIQKLGYIKNSDLDVNIEMEEAKKIVDKNLSKYKKLASKNKIISYASLNNFDEVKQALYIYKVPVILSIYVDRDGLILDNNYVAHIPTQRPYGAHAVMCYGWNEKGLLIQNSWGEEWGDKGTFILPFEYNFFEAWVIDFTNKDEQNFPIVKPKLYWLREMIMNIIKFINKILEFKRRNNNAKYK